MNTSRTRFVRLSPQRYLSSTPSQKKRVVIVGAGWGGFRCASDIDKRTNAVHVVSPRNHFLFTPLLPSTAVGTLEFRGIQEPVRNIKGLQYEQACVDSINFDEKVVECSDAFAHGHKFTLPYDILVLATGSETATFGTPGIAHYRGEGQQSHVYYLKQLEHSRAIRDRLIECFERASSPGVLSAEQQQLLTFVVVGGGPTNIEFASELFDFLSKDVARLYPDLHGRASVLLVEAGPKILGSFHANIGSYVSSTFKRRKIKVLTGHAVKRVANDIAELDNGEKIPFGLLVWSAGNQPTPLISSLFSENARVKRHPGNGRLVVNASLQVLSPQGEPVSGVFALGDCAADQVKPLPALAQVAQQQGAFLAAVINSGDKGASFVYRHLGAMMAVGNYKGVYDSTGVGTEAHHFDGPQVTGFLAFVLWRAAYWTKSVSLQNKLLLAMYWFKSFVFGRDVSRF